MGVAQRRGGWERLAGLRLDEARFALAEGCEGAVEPGVAEERSGLTGLRRPEFWRGQLTRLLAAHALFTQLPDGSWALAAWTSASATLRSMRYVVVDVETTGLSPRTQTLIEIAALRCLGAQVIDTFTTLVDPGRPIPPFIRRFTGITDDMVAGAPGLFVRLKLAGDATPAAVAVTR